MVECHAGRYLTQYATAWDIFGNRGEDLATRCAWNFTNDPQWRDCWLMAIDMPRHALTQAQDEEVIDEAVSCRSLSVLFRHPKQEIRPNELIYRAWHLFEFDERLFLVGDELKYGQELSTADRTQRGRALLLPGADAVLAEFRASSRELVKELEQNRLAQQGRMKKPDSAGWLDYQRWVKPWQNQERHTKSRTFVQCPPQSWIDEQRIFDMQTGQQHDGDPCVHVLGEESNKQVCLVPYWMLATPVTRGMYCLFDPAFETSQVADS